MTVDDLVKDALGSRPVPKSVSALIPQATKFVRFGAANWAVFPVAGAALSKTDIEGIELCKDNDVRPVLATNTHDGVKVIREHFASLGAWVLSEIAGQSALLSPLSLSPPKRRKKGKPTVRVSDDQLKAITTNAKVPAQIKKFVKQLRSSYAPIYSSDEQNDAREESVLLGYARNVRNRSRHSREKLRSCRRGRLVACRHGWSGVPWLQRA
jgi:hypothetical protein